MSHRVDEMEVPAAVLDELRRLPDVDPVARTRLGAALERNRRGTGTIVLSPARAVVAAALLMTATSLAWYMGTRAHLPAAPLASVTPAAPTAVAGRGPLTPVQFVLVAPDARSVALAGDFNGWNPAASPLRPGEGGVWSIVLPLERGAFSYSFVIDGGEWRADPRAAFATDDFGRPSSVLFVTPET